MVVAVELSSPCVRCLVVVVDVVVPLDRLGHVATVLLDTWIFEVVAKALCKFFRCCLQLGRSDKHIATLTLDRLGHVATVLLDTWVFAVVAKAVCKFVG